MITTLHFYIFPMKHYASEKFPENFSFPDIPKWDFTNTTQIISPVDNPENTGIYGKTNNHLWRFTRLHPKKLQESQEIPEKECIWLTGIDHRNPYAMIEMYDTIQKQYDATFTFFDNPKASYNRSLLANQVVHYMHQVLKEHPNKRFILFGASMWEWLAREIYRKINHPEHITLLDHIDHHFSVCWVSTRQNLWIPMQWALKLAGTGIGREYIARFSRYVAKNIGNILEKGFVNKIIGDTLFSPTWGKFDEIMEKSWKKRHGTAPEGIGPHLTRSHRKRWALGYTKAHENILETIAGLSSDDLKNAHTFSTPPATILYSSNDPLFRNPEKNATESGNFYQHYTHEKIEKGNHVDIVYQHEKYLTPILKQMDILWNKNHPPSHET